ncbi:penicillin acylase family protein [Niabella drilacis]|uniref:Penicillin amidase n=1 Tax=Niabella drilacis (strain DSM 25811 / CCM 8410 / CCUG 62505 / LMG 26954 / E90) TaxID=1285928 RepID=A0A1G6YF39_NIADE|nr:penicillin acylase family protein [Niabella drilacis]SDD88337.1 penicillin amidase [Niabella drilacis]
MRVVPFLAITAVTVLLIYLLNRPIGDKVPMPLGSFLNPQTGFWQNAEDTAAGFNEALSFPQLKGKVSVYFDERLVPHVFAERDEDLYFVQGYLHAKFRLFQMDLQTRAAEGRVSEIAGVKAINYDREQRRLGMKFAAENSLQAMEKDARSLQIYSAYTAGINAYIHSLKKSGLPLEYKILDFEPEEWTNLRTALLLKMMAKMLASGTEKDLAYTRLHQVFSTGQLNALYPQVPDSLKPIVPPGTLFPAPGVSPVTPADADTAYFKEVPPVTAFEQSTPDPDNGSNNWVVAGSKTAGKAPILANDPHLELSLPSIWYEMQLSTPQGRAYGATLPGSPYIIIGFNDSIAWGVTNAQRDVKDYFAIRFKNSRRNEYWFHQQWKPAQQRIEAIGVKGRPTIYDTVAYTVFGPVMYDETFRDTLTQNNGLAVKWAAHHTGDDGNTFYLLNRAKNYEDYVNAIRLFECPGQNFVFASKSDTIALWQQGKFPARWNNQGMYVMPGTDSRYDWQALIPQAENPHAVNPGRGYLFSANQRPADARYPYYIPGAYITPRAGAIDQYLGSMNHITVQDMMELQNNYFNIMARDMVPLMLKYTDEDRLSAPARKYYSMVKDWDLFAGPSSAGQTVYQVWMDSLLVNIWQDELGRAGFKVELPAEQTLMELLEKDSTVMGYVDNINTAARETIHTQMTDALNKTAVLMEGLEKDGKLEWAKFKDVSIYHLLGNALLPFARTGLNVGGWSNIINAVKKSHGPSWRMVVQLSTPTEAYGVYPGGQSGNPGSRFYDNAIDTWASGKYYRLWFMSEGEERDTRVKWRMDFSKG